MLIFLNLSKQHVVQDPQTRDHLYRVCWVGCDDQKRTLTFLQMITTDGMLPHHNEGYREAPQLVEAKSQ